VNALCDALVDYGVELDTLPLTPEVVWRAMRRR
jgi:carbon-monoxide dehydrogenase large subunit